MYNKNKFSHLCSTSICHMERRVKFEREFFIIPSQDLIDKISKYHRGGDMVNMYLRIFNYNNERKVIDSHEISKKNLVKEINNPYRDYEKNLNYPEGIPRNDE